MLGGRISVPWQGEQGDLPFNVFQQCLNGYPIDTGKVTPFPAKQRWREPRALLLAGQQQKQDQALPLSPCSYFCSCPTSPPPFTPRLQFMWRFRHSFLSAQTTPVSSLKTGRQIVLSWWNSMSLWFSELLRRNARRYEVPASVRLLEFSGLSQSW